MTKQSGLIKISGAISNICFYRLHGEHYARTKSSLSGKRVKHDPAFKETMKYAALLARASKIASVIYRRLPAEQKSRKKYQAMAGQAMELLKKKMDIDMVIEILKIWNIPSAFYLYPATVPGRSNTDYQHSRKPRTLAATGSVAQ
ncbi:MAG TPA: hypothetical protein VFU29_22405 [Chitinophagaceae bacterium]|nr:hypothetical protein [Chitinophagaceae bacterium]